MLTIRERIVEHTSRYDFTTDRTARRTMASSESTKERKCSRARCAYPIVVRRSKCPHVPEEYIEWSSGQFPIPFANVEFTKCGKHTLTFRVEGAVEIPVFVVDPLEEEKLAKVQ
ncbi:MAG: hypothetical protein AMS18_08585 [Gemmatimonas sp. SG8_17]|nr:MAG: hypothetical protein AMS18_08585 [Gemmatimonas sp. SG8_17]